MGCLYKSEGSQYDWKGIKKKNIFVTFFLLDIAKILQMKQPEQKASQLMSSFRLVTYRHHFILVGHKQKKVNCHKLIHHSYNFLLKKHFVM